MDYARQLNEEKDKETIEAWFRKADEVRTLDDLSAFLKHLTTAYRHDYGTIVHAIVAGCIATAKAIDRSPVGGITGFQASCAMWGFITRFMHYEKQPMRLVRYEEMLYPQYAYKFARTITPDTWKWLQDEAKKHLALFESGERPCARAVRDHWASIAAGTVPFGYSISDKT